MPTDHDTPSTAAIALATAILSLATGYFIGSASSINLFSSSSSSSSSSTSHRKQKKQRQGKQQQQKKSWPNSYDVTIHPDSSDEELMARLNADATKPSSKTKKNEQDSTSDDDSEDDSASTTSDQNLELDDHDPNDPIKLVLVVRSDLGMGKGKIAAQVAHATLACYNTLTSNSSSSSNPKSKAVLRRWEREGQAKVVVQTGGSGTAGKADGGGAEGGGSNGEDDLLTLQAQAISLGLCARVVRDAGRTQVVSGTATVLGVGPGPKGLVDRVTGGLKLL